MIEELIPIVLFLVTALVVYVVTYFRYRSRQELHVTVRGALEQGVQLPENLLAQLAQPRSSKEVDLRRGILAVALAFAFFICAFLLDASVAQRPLLAAGVFPLLVGLAYLGLWRFAHRAD